MKFPRLLAVLTALVSLSVVAVGSASATTLDECQTQLATLRADTVDAQASFTNGKDVNSLLGKLDEAAAKLDQR